jgi:hypothetical protein
MPAASAVARSRLAPITLEQWRGGIVLARNRAGPGGSLEDGLRVMMGWDSGRLAMYLLGIVIALVHASDAHASDEASTA